MRTETADKAIRQRAVLLRRLCLTKPNKNDTAPNETASSVRASAIERNKLAGMMGKLQQSQRMEHTSLFKIIGTKTSSCYLFGNKNQFLNGGILGDSYTRGCFKQQKISSHSLHYIYQISYSGEFAIKSAFTYWMTKKLHFHKSVNEDMPKMTKSDCILRCLFL